MSQTVLDTVDALTTSDFLRTTARQLAEGEDAVAQALKAAAAVLLARLTYVSDESATMNRVASLIEPRADEAGHAQRREDSSSSAYVPPSVGASGSSSPTATQLGRGTALLNVILGPRLPNLVTAMAAHCGVSQTSARALVGHAAPLVLRALGVRLDHTSLGPAGMAPSGLQLADLLARDGDAFLEASPVPLLAALDKEPEHAFERVTPPAPPIPAPVSGTAAARPAPPVRASAPPPAVMVARETGAQNGGLLGRVTGRMLSGGGTFASDAEGSSLAAPTLVGGLVALALLWWMFLPGLYAPYALRVDPLANAAGRGRTDDRGRVQAPPVPLAGPGTAAGGSFSSPVSSTPSSSAAPAAITGLLRLIKRTLPSNKQIDFIEDGIEGRMIALIENRNQPLERTLWFDFDRLNFQTGSSNLTSDSRVQVQNIADILSSYPAVKIKIGGYTDNVGEPQNNQRLSEARAQRVMTELISLGVNALRLDAEGYGDQHPIAENTTPEGRTRNRRISVRVTER